MNTENAFYDDLHFKKIAKEKVRENMGKNKKCEYNINIYNGLYGNMCNKFIESNFSYKSDDIFKTIDSGFRDANITDTNRNKQESVIDNKLEKNKIIEKDKI